MEGRQILVSFDTFSLWNVPLIARLQFIFSYKRTLPVHLITGVVVNMSLNETLPPAAIHRY